MNASTRPGAPHGGAWASRVGRLSLGGGEVLTVRPVGALRHVTVADDALAALVRPGHLVSLVPPDASVRVRRAVPVAGGGHGTYGGTVELLLHPDDAGRLAPRDRLDLLGPLGRPLRWPSDPVPVVVLGHGRAGGQATWVAERLAGRGCSVHVVLTASTSSLVADTARARRAASTLTVATLDGTAGSRGDGADLVAALVQRSGAALVYAAGPLAGLAGVVAAAAAQGASTQCLVDDPAPCITGACGACAVPSVDAAGDTVLVRPCLEGPALDGDAVRWDVVEASGRRVPGGTVVGRRPR